MDAMNRRSFLRLAASVSTAAALGHITGRVSARQATAEYVSELTNSAVVVTDEMFTINMDSAAVTTVDGGVEEYISIGSEGSTIEIMFVQTAVTPEQYLKSVQQKYATNWDRFEPGDSGVTEGGAWFTGLVAGDDLAFNMYVEYQAGAYENADLVVFVNSGPESIVTSIADAQAGIEIGDAAPLLLMAGSDTTAYVFPLPQTATSGSTASTSNGRQTRTNTTTAQQSSTTTPEPSTAVSDYRQAVIDHRTDFLASFTIFAESLAVIGDEAALDADKESAIVAINGVAAGWIAYPGQAGQLAAPADEAVLSGLYVTWADEIATLGFAWQDASNGTADVAIMFDQLDVVDAADKALMAELGVGSSFLSAGRILRVRMAHSLARAIA